MAVTAGNMNRYTGTFTLDDGQRTPFDPDTVTVKIVDNVDAVTALVYGTDTEVVKTGTGVYYVDVTLTQTARHGWWQIIFIGTGDVPVVTKYDVEVEGTRAA